MPLKINIGDSLLTAKDTSYYKEYKADGLKINPHPEQKSTDVSLPEKDLEGHVNYNITTSDLVRVQAWNCMLQVQLMGICITFPRRILPNWGRL